MKTKPANPLLMHPFHAKVAASEYRELMINIIPHIKANYLPNLANCK